MSGGRWKAVAAPQRVWSTAPMDQALDERAAVAINLANRDERATAHAASPDYHLDAFDDEAYLSDVVRFDLPRPR